MSTSKYNLTPGDFVTTLLDWQQSHGRHDLPWQLNPSPYRVLVSEIMLQQTQVATVIPYFEKWISSFPDIDTLAAASEDQVMSHWQGLGYYSRARNLRKAAIYITEELQGEFPQQLTELIKIPGVGRYTAGAIASFAYNQFGPIVDGNVKRLFCRYFGIEGVPGTSAIDKQLWHFAELYTPDQNNRRFAQGLLDMGATVCKAKQPDCQNCAFNTNCVAYIERRVDQLPTAKPKKALASREGHFIWQQQGNKLQLERRPDSGIWGALWCLPELKTMASDIAEPTAKSYQAKGKFKHTFTHYKLDAKVWKVEQNQQLGSLSNWFTREECEQLGLPTPIKKFILQHLKDNSKPK